MDRFKMHNMMEHIKTQPEFPFDALDVEESLDNVLSYFGLHPQLDEQERHEITRDLLKLALSGELAEMLAVVAAVLVVLPGHVQHELGGPGPGGVVMGLGEDLVGDGAVLRRDLG